MIYAIELHVIWAVIEIIVILSNEYLHKHTARASATTDPELLPRETSSIPCNFGRGSIDIKD